MSVNSEQIKNYLKNNPKMMLTQVATQLQLSELQVVRALPVEQLSLLPVTQKDELLESLPQWGAMTTIVAVSGSIFEFKGAFPKGEYGHGYYNLITEGDGLHGHLKLDNISAIALISRPVRGKQSHSINFFGEQGEIVFKVYLGRDEQGVLLSQQLHRFNALKPAMVGA